MDLRQLRYFVTLADTRNFHRAAERLHMSQPPLTVAIRKLEEELGAPLFDRGARGVTLTPAGATSLEIARATLAQADRFKEAVREGAAGRGGGSASASSAPRPSNCCHASSPNIATAIRPSNWCWKKRPALTSPANWQPVNWT
ncbi:LysR family transcriptional regulator [Sphingobium sp. HWE2-09]|uniref:LysR family transcriptional regulator n=1 Tax=Sphingobium sp. HWE2-09 TaxID=3108390 RepID=UPI002DC64918|nr:LysR family transcriptional regulator [Sphingobium sp. HWE2-09]